MKKSLFAILVAVFLLVAFVPAAFAQGPIETRLQQEPGLRCFAADLHVSNEAMARFKLVTDYVYGDQQNVKTEGQWQATWFDRFQFLADILGVSNPMVPDNMSGAHPNPGCQRLIDAQRLIEQF